MGNQPDISPLNKMGRPKKEFDENQFEKLCGLQCTEEEIAYFFDFSVDTLCRRCKEIYGETFAETYKKYNVDGKISIRRAQYLLAVNDKNCTMLIWLGKQYLGQKDQTEIIPNVDRINEAINNLPDLMKTTHGGADKPKTILETNLEI